MQRAAGKNVETGDGYRGQICARIPRDMYFSVSLAEKRGVYIHTRADYFEKPSSAARALEPSPTRVAVTRCINVAYRFSRDYTDIPRPLIGVTPRPVVSYSETRRRLLRSHASSQSFPPASPTIQNSKYICERPSIRSTLSDFLYLEYFRIYRISLSILRREFSRKRD